MPFFRSHVLVSVDPACIAAGAHDVIDALNDELVAQANAVESAFGATAKCAELLASMQSDVADLRTELHDLRRDNEDLRGRIQALEAEKEELQLLIDDFRSENANLIRRLNASQAA